MLNELCFDTDPMIKGMYKVNWLEWLYDCAVAKDDNQNQRQSIGWFNNTHYLHFVYQKPQTGEQLSDFTKLECAQKENKRTIIF